MTLQRCNFYKKCSYEFLHNVRFADIVDTFNTSLKSQLFRQAVNPQKAQNTYSLYTGNVGLTSYWVMRRWYYLKNVLKHFYIFYLKHINIFTYFI